jgi:hypothetical protein
MEVFDEALSKTNYLMETMDNFNSHKRIEKNNDESIKNDSNNNNNNFNSNISRKNNKSKTYNQKKSNKSQLKPIINNQYTYKKREPYNYQKEYENELVNQIEKLFNPSYQKNGNEEIGLLSFLSPLINSNVDEKNKKFYKKKLNINKSKVNNELNKINNDINNEKYNDPFSNESFNNIWNRGLNKKFSKNEKKLKTIVKKSISKKKNENSLDRQTSQKSFGEKFKRNDKYRRSKYDIPEISELKKNRYFSRTKTNFRNAIVARDRPESRKKKESNVEQLINRLKKHYS